MLSFLCSSERVQFNMLCEQSLNNVWRKKAFAALMARYPSVGGASSSSRAAAAVVANVPPALASLNLSKCLDVFRERIDHSVNNGVPKHVRFAQKLDGAVALVRQQEPGLITDPKEQVTFHLLNDGLLRLLLHSTVLVLRFASV